MRLFKVCCLLFLRVSQGAITRGINWYGHETELGKFSCSWANPMEYYLEKLSGLGFNSLRIPFSHQYVRNGDFSSMDHFFDIVPNYNMTVVLDFHRVNNYAQSPVPTDGISKEEFWDTWTIIADRYKDRKELIALELFNEYQGSDAGYWNDLMRQTVLHLEDRFPQRFDYYVNGMNWGGNLAGISLEDLSISNRIFYTCHKYIFSGNSVPSDWDISFGSYPEKVIITEFGFKREQNELAWGRTFVDYLKNRGIRNTYFWCLGISGDTGGILDQNDCATVEWEKLSILKDLWAEKQPRSLLRGGKFSIL